MKHQQLLAALILGVVQGCSGSSTPPPDLLARTVEQTDQALNRPPTLRIGEDCSVLGKSACRSDLCIHYSAQPTRDWVCSRNCGATRDCPQGWACQRLLPGQRQARCIPGPTWTARPAFSINDSREIR